MNQQQIIELDQIIENFIKNNDYYIQTLPIVVEYSKKVFQENEIFHNNDWSRKFSLNESINIIYTFLETIDKNLANQFLNTINSKDTDNKPYVNFLSKSEYPNGEDRVDSDGRVYIYYENTPNDIFIILHELLHKMNECMITDNHYDIYDSITRNYLSETVSILGEMMIGNYLLECGLITENDFNKRKNKRIIDTKGNARDIIVENELINLKLKKGQITFQNLIDVLKQYDKSSIEYKILEDEKNDLRRIKSILRNKKLNLKRSERYVIAKVLVNEFLKRDTLTEDFIKLHNTVGNVDTSINEVIDYLNIGLSQTSSK